jgi:cold shock CspA family protein
LTIAEELAPESAFVKLETARVLQYQRRFDEAAARLEAIGGTERLSSRTRRVHLDLSLQNKLRQSEELVAQHDFRRALECLEAAKAIIEHAASSLIDQETTRHVLRKSSQFRILHKALEGHPEEGTRVRKVIDWLLNPAGWFGSIGSTEALPAVAQSEPSMLDDSKLPPNRGKLIQMHPTFAFIDAGGMRFFFHRKDWKAEVPYSPNREGAIVDFDLGSNSKGVCAVNVRPITADAKPAEPAHDWQFGEVVSIFVSHGFIQPDEGRSVFFHRETCTDPIEFKAFVVGTRVKFRLGANEKGKARAENVEAHH